MPPPAFPKYRSRFGKQAENAHTVFQNIQRGEVELSITLSTLWLCKMHFVSSKNSAVEGTGSTGRPVKVVAQKLQKLAVKDRNQTFLTPEEFPAAPKENEQQGSEGQSS